MSQPNPLSHLKKLTTPFILFSLVTNLAVLVSPIFMMQVLDRVVPSGNLNTLYMLLMVAIGAIIVHGYVEFQRDICLQRTAQWIEAQGARAALRLSGANRQSAIQSIGVLRDCFKGQLARNAINIPWIPLFIGALALIHPYFVLLLTGVIGLLFLISFLLNLITAEQKQKCAVLSKQETQILRDATDFQLAAGIRAIGKNLTARFFQTQAFRHQKEETIITATTLLNSALGVVRMSSQLLALSVGAGLVVNESLSAGGMIGASIIMAKTVQIIEASMHSTASICQVWAAYSRLKAGFQTPPKQMTEVSHLSGTLKCKDLIHPRGGGAPARIDRVSFSLKAGECLAIVGDSGSGKTTLLHALCGIDPCPIGSTFLDETEVRTLGPETAAMAIGYLPQQARMVKGTLAENISCFSVEADDDKVIKAAKTAGVHGLISALPESYDTDIGAAPHLLSAGQKQRIALARAIYENPKYLFLDEPNALLDTKGERQLCDTLALLKRQGTTIIMVLHRSGIMGLADYVMFLDQGRMADFGARSEVLGRITDRKQQITIPLVPTSLQDLNDWIVAQFTRNSDSDFCYKAVLVGTEIFNIACQNGPSDVMRQATFIFKFIDDKNCEFSLREDQPTTAAGKMAKIKSLIQHPEVNMFDLSPDEIALAVVAQMANKFEVRNINNTALFSASLSSDKISSRGVSTH